MDALEEIRKIYFSTTKGSIQRDFERAIDLIKSLPDEASREKAAVFMEGIAQMRTEWSASARGNKDQLRRDFSPSGSRPQPSGPQRGGPPGRSGRSKASSRRTG